MEGLSRNACWSLALLVLLGGIAVAGVQAPPKSRSAKGNSPLKPKDVSACDLITDSAYAYGGCMSSVGGSCYYCEYTNPRGSYVCYEAPDPAEGTACYSLDYQLP